MRDSLTLAVERAWFQTPKLLLLLLPLEWLFAALTAFRRLAFRKGWLSSGHPGVPVIVVGNLTVGGTGKTPVVLGITQSLIALGFRVAVVSRGYGGSSVGTVQVTPHSDYREVGDEALLVAQSSDALVVVGRDRLAAAKHAVRLGAEVIISDDGLQHYALQRDVEVVTSDAKAGFGNGHLLPVGPLREPPRRLATVDFFLQRGGQDPHSGTRYHAKQFRRLSDGELRSTCDPGFGPAVHAVAAIAQPQRFFETLRGLGMEPIEHCFADHRPFLGSDFDGLDDLPVVLTAKDAVKCPGSLSSDIWILDMEIEFPEGFVEQLLKRASLLGAKRASGSNAQSASSKKAAPQTLTSGGDAL
ncbi:tetraacyldisaccharide 4'-kinase [Congregibacter variabilis]|uniref:Tetraacyldisaccharide 4'-kinase n=1 Tax=Congregibacter variabilis TaxID=3081200 RepID=A0ABZ0I4X2_9GAMM|nr:tetraacyldisaccharide 4'-kinase [Congregibacter sp. IMCC43200]